MDPRVESEDDNPAQGENLAKSELELVARTARNNENQNTKKQNTRVLVERGCSEVGQASGRGAITAS
jgi:hypothetical protein